MKCAWRLPASLRVQGLYGSETKPEYGFDASLEEILHLISSVGYAQAYPDVFGEEAASTIAAYMDTARGGHFEERQAADCEDDGNGPCALPPGREYPAGGGTPILIPPATTLV